MVSVLCRAQYSNHQLYQAYLNQEMSVWEEYIVSAQWDKLSLEGQKQLLNYEYGFTAYMLTVDTDKANEFLTLYEKHLELLKTKISAARYHAYLASVYTYKLALDKMHFVKYAKNIFANVDRAMELDNQDPLVVSMKGNVEFYSPLGSKKKALEFFQKADKLYAEKGAEYEQWNHKAVEANIEMCKEKLNK
jgi:hypothetical protein